MGLKAIFLGFCVLNIFVVVIVHAFVFCIVTFRRCLSTFRKEVFLPASGFKERWEQCLYESVVESSRNKMAHGDAREGK